MLLMHTYRLVIVYLLLSFSFFFSEFVPSHNCALAAILGFVFTNIDSIQLTLKSLGSNIVFLSCWFPWLLLKRLKSGPSLCNQKLVLLEDRYNLCDNLYTNIYNLQMTTMLIFFACIFSLNFDSNECTVWQLSCLAYMAIKFALNRRMCHCYIMARFYNPQCYFS